MTTDRSRAQFDPAALRQPASNGEASRSPPPTAATSSRLVARTNQELKALVKDMMGLFPIHMDEVIAEFGELQPEGIEGPDASNRGCIVWPFCFKNQLGNIHEKLHGGIAAYLVDSMTSIHLTVLSGRPQHVSTQLGVQYIRPVPLNETVLVKTFVNGMGRNTAFLEAQFWSADGKALFVTATHTKLFLDGKKDVTSEAKL